MSPARTVFAALALTAFLACSPVLEPEVSVDVSSPAFSGGHDDDEGEEEFDMNARFATEMTGASGSGDVEWEDGSVEIEVEVEGLLPNTPYELKVTIGTGGDATLAGFNTDFGFVTFGPVTSDDDGEVEFEEDLDLLGLFGPGLYRLDLFVTHIGPTVDGAPGVGAFLTTIFNRDPLLACQPAPSFIVIAADDDDDGDDDDEGEEEFDMNARFATEMTGASGSGDVEWEDGSVEIEVEVEGLLPNTPYELKVTIGTGGDATLAGFNTDFGFVTFGPVTSDDDGEVEFEEDLDLLGLFGPGLYRLDLFVTHIGPTVDGAPGVGAFLTTIFNRDPLLACQPAPSFIVIAADDDDDDDDD